MQDYPDELYHYGVLGMKWGIRRYQSYNEKPRKSGKSGKELGEAAKSTREARQAEKRDRRNASRNRRYLSDDELNTRLNRLQREKQLKTLTDEDLSSGKKWVKALFKKYEEFNKPARKIIASAFLAVGFYYTKSWMEAIFGAEVASQMVNPFKKK